MGGREANLVLLDKNGIRCDGRKVNETNGLLKALAAIRMVEEQAHLANLTDKMKKMLESNGV